MYGEDAAAMAAQEPQEGENERHGGRPTPAGRGRRRSLVRPAPRTAHEARRHARLSDRAGVANSPARGKGHQHLSRGGNPIF